MVAQTRQEFKRIGTRRTGTRCVSVRVRACVWGGVGGGRRGEGVHRQGKGTSLSAPPEGWNSSRAVPPIWQALVKTIPQLLVTLQIQ